MRLIVCGSRDFNDYHLFNHKLNQWKERYPDLVLISGGARGADSMAEWWAGTNNVNIRVFPADWKRFGKKAGRIRNEEMAQEGDACIAFWDGMSPGTRHMIREAQNMNLELEVVRT